MLRVTPRLGEVDHGVDFEAGLFTHLLPVMGGKLKALALAESGTGVSYFTPLEIITAPKCHSHLAVLREFHWKPRKNKKKTCLQMPSPTPRQTEEAVLLAHL